jgi:hypothetical protein
MRTNWSEYRALGHPRVYITGGTVQELTKNMSSGKQIDAILLDLSKAFDRVPHRRLLMKLDYYGIRGTTLGHCC